MCCSVSQLPARIEAEINTTNIMNDDIKDETVVNESPQTEADLLHEELSSKLTVSGANNTNNKSKNKNKGNKNGKRESPHFVVHHDYHDHADEHPDQSANECLPRRGGVTTPFPIKLHEMLDRVDSDGNAEIVSWQPHGRCFVVHKPKEFKALLPKYFKQSKMGSFLRQLNLYGFSRLTRGKDKGGYYHELFLRGRHFLAHQIHRIKVKGTGVRARSNPQEEPDLWGMSWIGCTGEADGNTDMSTGMDPSQIPPPCVSRCNSLSSSGSHSSSNSSLPQLSNSSKSLAQMNTSSSFAPMNSSPTLVQSNSSPGFAQINSSTGMTQMSSSPCLSQMSSHPGLAYMDNSDANNLSRMTSSPCLAALSCTNNPVDVTTQQQQLPIVRSSPTLAPVPPPIIEEREPSFNPLRSPPRFVQSGVESATPDDDGYKYMESALRADGLIESTLIPQSQCHLCSSKAGEDDDDDIVWSFGGKCFHYMDPLQMFEGEERPAYVFSEQNENFLLH